MELNKIRDGIDNIDNQIKELFEKRMALAAGVARFKHENKLPVLNSTRERDILVRVTAGQDEEMAGYTKILYNTLFDLSKAHQNHLIVSSSALVEKIKYSLGSTPDTMPRGETVACQGIDGANSQLACEKLFGYTNILYVNNFEGVFAAVEQNLCRYGILPLENNLCGSVNEVYDLMKKYHFYIVKSVKLHISHSLLVCKGTSADDIRKIYSHPQAIGQCSEFLKKFPNAEVIAYTNTAAAAKYVADSQHSGIAAIAPPCCAEIYGLDIAADNISDSENNYTRFICISRELEIYPGANRMSIVCTVPHKAGALYALISKFAAYGINLVKLESRPIPGRDFEFMFYCDMDASVYSPEVLNLLSSIESGECQTVFLGSYSEI